MSARKQCDICGKLEAPDNTRWSYLTVPPGNTVLDFCPECGPVVRALVDDEAARKKAGR
jgi:hypothetical protein